MSKSSPFKPIRNDAGKIVGYNTSSGLNVFANSEHFEDLLYRHKDHCFVCLRQKDDKDVPFNEEHIIPNWILRDFDLHSKKITFPNKTTYMYGRYTLPCCVSCNSLLNEVYEKQISTVFREGYQKLLLEISTDNYFELKMYMWMNLIFTKTHLNDANNDLILDKRKHTGEKICDTYQFKSIHHLWCLMRSIYTQASFDSRCIGTFLKFELVRNSKHDYDYHDIMAASANSIVYKDIGLIAVHNDYGAVKGRLNDMLNKITGPLTLQQFKEIYTNVCYCSMSLRNRPIFRTSINAQRGSNKILTDVTGPPLFKFEQGVFQGLHKFILPELQSDENYIDPLTGRYRYISLLWDHDGNFIDHSKDISKLNVGSYLLGDTKY